MNNMIEQRGWREFKDSKLLWWVNRSLHLFGWAIVYHESDEEGITVYPARVKFRGFPEDVESEGFAKLTEYLEEEASILRYEASK